MIKLISRLGVTNCLAIYILLLITAGLAGGFVLAWRSITHGYLGALACYTAALAPIGTALGIVLGKVVDKNRAENVNGEMGIVFASAQAKDFNRADDSANSPAI